MGEIPRHRNPDIARGSVNIAESGGKLRTREGSANIKAFIIILLFFSSPLAWERGGENSEGKNAFSTGAVFLNDNRLI